MEYINTNDIGTRALLYRILPIFKTGISTYIGFEKGKYGFFMLWYKTYINTKHDSYIITVLTNIRRRAIDYASLNHTLLDGFIWLYIHTYHNIYYVNMQNRGLYDLNKIWRHRL